MVRDFKSKNRYRKRRRFVKRRVKRSIVRTTLTSPLVSYKPQSLYKFRRKYNVGSVSTSALTGEVLGSQYFTLDSLPNYAEYTSLFDRYQLTYIKFEIIWRSNNLSYIETANNSAIAIPRIFMVEDRDDSNLATTIDQLREYQSCRMTVLNSYRRVASMSMRPNHLGMVFQDLTHTAYSPKCGWLDCGYPAAPHYGIKWGIEVQGTGGSRPIATFDLEATVWVAFKDPR